jgi:hypothetical protein
MKALVHDGPGKSACEQKPRAAIHDSNGSVARITPSTIRNNEINLPPVTDVTAKDRVLVVSS